MNRREEPSARVRDVEHADIGRSVFISRSRVDGRGLTFAGEMR